MKYIITQDETNIEFYFTETENFPSSERSIGSSGLAEHLRIQGWIVLSVACPAVDISPTSRHVRKLYLPGTLTGADNLICGCSLIYWASLRKVLYTVCTMVNRGEFHFPRG
jgi:hypothetical protein